MKRFWNFTKVKNDESEEEPIKVERVLSLNGTIADESWFDDDITPALFKDELLSDTGDLTVWINSPGGDCIAAAQIYNMLMDYKGNVTVKIDGICASAASVIAMAGNKVMMSPVSMLMIHNPVTLAQGDSTEMKKAIAMLNEVKESIINAYEIKTDLPRNTLSHLMDNETWMDANSALSYGFCDEIMKRETTEPPQNKVFFSAKDQENNLLSKIYKKTKIKSKEETAKRIKASELLNRLELLKTWI